MGSSGTINRIGAFGLRYAALINRYRGGMPVGFMASYAIHEGGGVMGTYVAGADYTIGGDAAIGEAGIFQVTRDAASRFGFDPSFRLTLEGNFFLAGLNLNVDCATAANRYGVEPGSKDAWLYAMLWYALGPAAADFQWAAAGYPSDYQGMLDFAANGDVQGYGRVTADKERLRITTPNSYWNDGVAAGLPMVPGIPFLTPAPGSTPGDPEGYDYALPPGAADLIGVGDLAPWGIGNADTMTAGGVVAVGVLAALIAKAIV